jgi:hypothetical protein
MHQVKETFKIDSARWRRLSLKRARQVADAPIGVETLRAQDYWNFVGHPRALFWYEKADRNTSSMLTSSLIVAPALSFS